MDSVQAARFISDTKSRELIEKLGEADQPRPGRQPETPGGTGRPGQDHEPERDLTVDKLHQAINQKIQVRFHYMKWDTRKNLVPRNGGNWFQVSPWLMILSDEKLLSGGLLRRDP